MTFISGGHIVYPAKPSSGWVVVGTNVFILQQLEIVVGPQLDRIAFLSQASTIGYFADPDKVTTRVSESPKLAQITHPDTHGLISVSAGMVGLLVVLEDLGTTGTLSIEHSLAGTLRIDDNTVVGILAEDNPRLGTVTPNVSRIGTIT